MWDDEGSITLKRRARRKEAEGASRTFVVCAGRRVVGYFSLAAGSILHTASTGKVRRNMPDPVPAVFGYHELFHAFVIVAVGFQYAAVAFFVLPAH